MEKKRIFETGDKETFLRWVPEINRRIFENFKINRIEIEVRWNLTDERCPNASSVFIFRKED